MPTIDQKIVEIRFDNRDFEQNTKETMSTLDRLKAKLNFSGKEMNGLETAVVEAQTKFSMLEVVGVTALAKITSAAVDAGAKMVQELSGINNIISGWGKMEEKVSNVQTLLNSTGLDIDEINGYLDQLMWFSDETSYGFTDMTKALATMTSSGGDIKKLVPLITGVANATAFAGKGAAEFSRIMFNLNQSYGAGYLQLRDWWSIVQSGGNSKQLSEELIRAGEELGTIQKGEVTVGNLSETLKDRWANTEVMELAFGRFATFSQAVYEASQLAENEGLTASEIIEQLADQYDNLSVAAFRSAQEAKTFKEAMDATKDAAGSQWMKIFEAIFGNYKEQKEIWTELVNRLYDWFVAPLEKIEGLFKKAFKTGSYTALWDKLTNNSFIKSMDNVLNTMTNVNDAIEKTSEALKKATEPLETYQKLFDQIWNGDWGNGETRKNLLANAGYNYNTIQALVNLGSGPGDRYNGYIVTMNDVIEAEKIYGPLVKGNNEISEEKKEIIVDLINEQLDLNNLTDEQLDKLKEAKLLNSAEVSMYRDLRDGANKYGMSLDGLIDLMKKYNAHDLIFGRAEKVDENGNKIEAVKGALQNIYDIIDNIAKIVGKAFSDVFHVTSIDIFMAAKNLKEFTDRLAKIFTYNDETGEMSEQAYNLYSILKGIFSVIKLISTIVGGTFKIAWTIVTTVLKTFGKSTLEVGGFIGNMTSMIVKLIETGSPLMRFIETATKVVAEFIYTIYDWLASHIKLNQIFKYLEENIGNFIKQFVEWFNNLKKAIKDGKLVPFLTETFINVFIALKKIIKDGFSGMINWLVSGFGSIDNPIGKWFQGLGGAKEGKTLGQYIIQGLIDGLSFGISKLGGVVSGIFQIIVGTITGLFQIKSPSKVMIGIGGFIIAGLAAGISGGLGDLTKNIPAMFKPFTDIILAVLTKVTELIKGLNMGHIAIFAFGIGILKSLTIISKSLSVIEKGFESVNGVLDATKSFMKSLASVGKSLSLKLKADAIRSLAISIGIIIVAIIFLSKQLEAEGGFDRIRTATIIIVKVMAAFAVLLFAVNKFGGKINSNGTAIANIAISMLGIGAAMILIAKAISIISELVKNNTLDKSIDAFVVIIQLLVELLVVMALANAKIGGKTAKGGVGAFMTDATGMATSFLAMGAMMVLLAKAISKLGKMNPNQLSTGLTALAVVVQFVVEIIAVLGVFAMLSKEGSLIVKMGGTILAIAASFYIMAIVVKKLGKMEPNVLKQGISVLGVLNGFVLTIVSTLGAFAMLSKNGSIIAKIGGTVAAVGVMFILMAISVKILGSMDVITLGRGIAALGALTVLVETLLGVIGTISLLGETNLKGMATTLFGVATIIVAMVAAVILLGLMPNDVLAKGTIFVAIITLLVEGLVKSTEKAHNIYKTVGAIAILVAVIALSIGILSMIEANKLVGPTVAIGALIFLIRYISEGFKTIKSGTFKEAYKTLLLSSGFIAAAMGILVILSKIDSKNALPNALALTIILGALLGCMYVMSVIGKIDPGSIWAGVAGLLGVAAVAALAIGVLWIMEQANLQNAAKNALILSGFLIALTAVLVATTAVGLLYTATAGLAATGLGGLSAIIILCIPIIGMLWAMEQLQLTHAEENANLLIGFILKLTAVLLVLAPVGPLALMGSTALIYLTVVMAAMIGFATAVGTLMKAFPWLEEFLKKGLDVLIKVAEGIGRMIGAFVEGAIVEVSKVLPVLGTRLSQFMENAKTFIDGAKQIDDSVLRGVTTLGLVCLELTAAKLLDSVTRFMSLRLGQGNGGFEELGTRLSAFITNAKDFIEAAPKIDEGTAKGVENLADAILALTASDFLDNLAGKLLGKKLDFAGLGTALGGLGSGFASFVQNIGTFGDTQLDTIKVACEGIKALAEAEDALKNHGGALQGLLGDSSLGVFVQSLTGENGVGQAMATLCADLTQGGVTPENEDRIKKMIKLAAEIIGEFAEIAKNIPEQAGLFQLAFGGGTNFGAFVDTISGTGDKLKQFFDKFSNLPSNTSKTVNSLSSLINAFSNLGNITKGNNGVNLETLGKQFKSFSGYLPDSADNLKTFINDVAEYDATTIDKAKKNCVNVALAIYTIIKAMSTSVKDNSSILVNEFKELVETIVKEMKSNDIISKFKDVGKEFVNGLKNGINENQSVAIEAAKELGNKVKNALKVDSLDEHSPSKETYAMGKYFDEGLANGILDYAKYASKAASSVGENAKNGLTDVISKISDAIDSDMDTQPVIRPVLDLSNVSNGAGLINSMLSNPSMSLMSNLGSISYGINNRQRGGTNNDVVDAIDKLGKNIGNSGDTYNINGVTYDDGSAVSDAVSQLIRAINVERRM